MAKDLNLSVTLKAINKATGPLRKIRDGTLGAGTALKETRQKLRNLNDQQKRLSGFRDLSRQSLETRDALKEKREELRRVTEKLNTTEGPTRRLVQQQANAKEEVRKLNDKYRTQRERVGELARKLPPAADGVRGMTGQQEALDRQIRDTNERFQRQQDIMSRLAKADVGGKFRNMTTEVGKLGRRTAMLGGAAAGGIFALANSTATLGDDVAKTADKLGIGIGRLQELHYAAERSGLSTNVVSTATQRMVRRVSEAAQGTGAAKDAIAELGLSASDLAELTPDQQLAAFANALQDVTSQGDRVRLAMKLFDTEGVAMVNMLKDGSGGLEQYYRDARAVGYVLGDDAARGSEVFKDALLDAQSSLKGMKNTIGAELMPAITDLMKEFSGWIRENRDEVKAFAQTFGDRLREAVPIIKDVAKGVARLAGVLGDLTKKAANAVGGFDNLAFIVAGLFAGKAILSVVSFSVGVGKAIGALASFAMTFPKVAAGVKVLSAAFAATPIGWLVAGIAAVAGAAYLIYKHWGSIGPWFAALWEDLKAMPGRAWAGIKDAFNQGIGGVTRLLANWSPLGILWRGISTALDALGIELPSTLTGLGGAIIDGLIGGIDAKWQALKDKISGMASGITGWFKEKLGIASPSKVFAGFGANLLDGLINGIDEKWQLLKDKIGATAGAVTNWFKDKLGISSPSKVFAEFGVNTMQGYQQGLKTEEAAPLKEMDGFAKRLRQAGAGLAMGAAALAGPAAASSADGEAQRLEVPRLPTLGVDRRELPRLGIDSSQAPAFDARPPVTAPAGGGLTIQGGINITVQSSPGMDEQALAQLVGAEVQRALAAAERDAAARRRSAFHDLD